jgi:hypothetical protein
VKIIDIGKDLLRWGLDACVLPQSSGLVAAKTRRPAIRKMTDGDYLYLCLLLLRVVSSRRPSFAPGKQCEKARDREQYGPIAMNFYRTILLLLQLMVVCKLVVEQNHSVLKHLCFSVQRSRSLRPLNKGLPSPEQD